MDIERTARLVIRADASVEIGTGHVMRCLALAQAWQVAGGRVTFVLALVTSALAERLAAEQIEVVQIAALPASAADASQTIDAATEHEAACVVLDGYHFSIAYQRAIKEAGLRLLVVDDNGRIGEYCADVLLDQNMAAERQRYSHRAPETRLLLGTRYALLRREFWPWRGWQRSISRHARRVLVTMGGSDPVNATGMVIEALQQIAWPDLDVTIIAGSANANSAVLSRIVEQDAGRFRLLRGVSTMPELMAGVDIAISAGGSTCWELAFMQLPAVIITVADNQRSIAASLARAGVGINLGRHAHISASTLAEAAARLLEDADARQQMGARGRMLVDGRGARRVVEAIGAMR